MATIKAMTAGQLWKELDGLRKEREDFADLMVVVLITDQASYETEQAIDESNIDEEYTMTEIGEGVVYNLVVPTTIHADGTKGESYVRIEAVEWDEIDEIVTDD